MNKIGPLCEDNFHQICTGEFMTKQQIDAHQKSDDSIHGRKKRKTKCQCDCHIKKEK